MKESGIVNFSKVILMDDGFLFVLKGNLILSVVSVFLNFFVIIYKIML